MKIQRCKGTTDLSPQDMAVFRLIEGVFRDCCLKYGYQEVRTPTLEYLHLFTSVGTLTPSMLNKVYSFLDWDGWSGERVVLRPDGTIPVARLYIDSMEDKDLAKLFYVANMFVFDETGQKDREQWQCGAELIGAGSPLADTELVSLSLEILKRLNIKGIELRLSHAGLIKAMLGSLGLSHDEQVKAFDQILDGNESAIAELKLKNPELEGTLSSLLTLKGQSSGFLKNLKVLFSRSLPEVESHIDNFIDIVNYLEALDCDCQIDIASGAGFEYYTGLLFQLFAGGKKIGGGGRYDALIPTMGGKDIPASGFALYLDRLRSLVETGTLSKGRFQGVLVKGDWGDSAAFKRAFDIAGGLREAGYIAQLELRSQAFADFRWMVEVSSKAPPFVLADLAKNKKFEAETTGEVLKILEREGADKDSLA